jgi:hypothetical protein
MKKSLLIVFVLVIIFSCKNTPSTKEANSDTKEVSTTNANVSKERYAIKSGIVEYNTQVMGMDVKQTMTFDNYGKQDIQEVEMDMMGTKIHTVTLTRDGYIYNLDMVKRTGTKSIVTSMNNANIDFENLSDEVIKEMDLKKLGTEEFLGKTCEKMSIDYKKGGMKGTYLVYKGVALMVDTDMGSMKMKLVAEKFIENPEIPATRFEIPSDITITE